MGDQRSPLQIHCMDSVRLHRRQSGTSYFCKTEIAPLPYMVCETHKAKYDIAKLYGRQSGTSRAPSPTIVCCNLIILVNTDMQKAGRAKRSAFYLLCYIILPSVVIIRTATGIFLPLSVTAFLTACSIPPQHGTSIRATVMLRILFLFTISPSFSE